MSELVIFLGSCISISLLFFLVFWLFRDYRVDMFRQELFRLRDGFFDDALKIGLSFDHPAYGMIRTTINGTIRYAHKLNLPHFLIILVMVKMGKSKEVLPLSDQLLEAADDLTPEQTGLVMDYLLSLNLYMFRHMIISSPVAILTVILPVLIVKVISEQAGRIKLVAKFRQTLGQIDNAAHAFGNP